MDSILDKIRRRLRCKLRGRNCKPRFSKEIGSEFTIPKFPIKEHELQTHVLDLKPHKL